MPFMGNLTSSKDWIPGYQLCWRNIQRLGPDTEAYGLSYHKTVLYFTIRKTEWPLSFAEFAVKLRQELLLGAKATVRDTGYMHNKSLVQDYITRAAKRLLAVEVLYREKSWADVVRESQEIVELTLKALLRFCAVEVPRIHDVSAALEAEQERLPVSIQKSLSRLVHASKTLRRDRELAFYGSEDLTPSEFYSEPDAENALKLARETHALVAKAVGNGRE